MLVISRGAAPSPAFQILFQLILLTPLFAGCRETPVSLLSSLSSARKETKGVFPRFRPEPRWSDSLSLGNVSVPALTPPFPGEVSFSLKLPESAALDFSLALVKQEETSARVEFVVDAEVDGRLVTVFDEALGPEHANAWYPRRTDLSAWSGKRISLSFRTQPVWSDEPSPWADQILAAWGNPVLSHRPRGRPTEKHAPLADGVLRSTASGSEAEHPSIIVVLVDTLRPDYLGAYGFEGAVSPALDRLAMESVLFENCFTTAPWTKPAVASLFTSLHPEVHGVTNHENKFWSGKSTLERTGVLPAEATTLAEALASHGYRTAAFMANPWFGKEYGFEQGFERYETVWDTEKLLAAASAWIGSTNDTRPFFVYLHIMDAHAPYEVRRRDYHALLSSPSLGPSRTLTLKEYDAFPAHVKDTVVASDTERLERRSWRAKYAAAVRAFDRRAAPFLDQLRNTGVLDDAFLVLTADHGEELLQHGYWEHGNGFCDHQLHIPLLIRNPGGSHAGLRVRGLVSLVDLMPTLLAAGGVSAPSGLEGRDVSSLLTGESSAGDDAVFSYALLNDPGLHAMRTLTHKLILDPSKAGFRLYDLKADPEEQRDVASLEPAVAKELHDQLVRHLARMAERGHLATVAAPIPEELRERLKSLGYVR